MDKKESACQFLDQKEPTKIVAFTDAAGHSTTMILSGHSASLLRESLCTLYVTALSSGESQFYGVLRESPCALQVRQLLVNVNLKMEVGFSRTACSTRNGSTVRNWLWLQERTRAKDLHVGH